MPAVVGCCLETRSVIHRGPWDLRMSNHSLGGLFMSASSHPWMASEFLAWRCYDL